MGKKKTNAGKQGGWPEMDTSHKTVFVGAYGAEPYTDKLGLNIVKSRTSVKNIK